MLLHRTKAVHGSDSYPDTGSDNGFFNYPYLKIVHLLLSDIYPDYLDRSRILDLGGINTVDLQ